VKEVREMPSQNETYDVVVTRTFDAQKERVWRAWSDPDQVIDVVGTAGLHLAEVPDGLPRGRHDARVHAVGAGRGAVQHPDLPIDRADGSDRVRPGFADADGNQLDSAALGLPPGYRPRCPTVTLRAIDDASTELTVHEFGYPDAQIVEVSKAGMQQCLDKMAISLGAG
jgi:hypothetical protein